MSRKILKKKYHDKNCVHILPGNILKDQKGNTYFISTDRYLDVILVNMKTATIEKLNEYNMQSYELYL